MNTVLQSNRQTPLHLACSRQGSSPSAASLPTVDTLLAAGANTDIKDKDGNTPLHLACKMSLEPAVRSLLRCDANEMMANQHGLVAKDMVCDPNKEAILEMLALAPADRAWRRRRWLVSRRSSALKKRLESANHCPAAEESEAGEQPKQDDPITKKTRGDDAGEESGGNSGVGGVELDQERYDFDHLVGWVVDIAPEGIFELVVGFLSCAR